MNSPSQLRVLLTGAAGRIGRHLAPAFRSRYSQLRTFDRVAAADDPERVVGNLTDARLVREAMAGIDVVVHLAARATDGDFETILVPDNIIGMRNVFAAAQQAGVRRVVYASTGQVVAGWPAGHTVAGDDPLRPCSIYAVTKVFAEALGRYYHDRYQLEVIGVRIGAFELPGSANREVEKGYRLIWLSVADAVQLFQRSVETPGVGHLIVHGTSRTPVERLSLREARAVLGYEPQDSITADGVIERGRGES